MEKNYDLKQKARFMSKWFRSYYNEMETFLADLEEGVLTYNDEDFNRASKQFDDIQLLSVQIQNEFEMIQKLGGMKL